MLTGGGIMDPKRFETMVARAIDSIPDAFAEYLDNVVFLIEPFPDQETMEAMECIDEYDLLGLYQGDPLTTRGHDYLAPLPDHILLYQHPIELAAEETGEPIVKVIRDTILHEVGHHFGLSEEDLVRMGLD
jgi:predicted Zn-dependent protease with MMP-like domain